MVRWGAFRLLLPATSSPEATKSHTLGLLLHGHYDLQDLLLFKQSRAVHCCSTSLFHHLFLMCFFSIILFSADCGLSLRCSGDNNSTVSYVRSFTKKQNKKKNIHDVSVQWCSQRRVCELFNVQSDFNELLLLKHDLMWDEAVFWNCECVYKEASAIELWMLDVLLCHEWPG